MSTLKEKVINLELTENVKFLGKKSNPYSYHKAYDIYL